MFTGIKFNNMEVLKQIVKDYKKDDITPMREYCTEKKNQRAADYLNGLDPDAEAERKKRKKQGQAKK